MVRASVGVVPPARATIALWHSRKLAAFDARCGDPFPPASASPSPMARAIFGLSRSHPIRLF